MHDPYEAQNRKAHEFNKALDRNVIRPASRAYGAVPAPVRTGVSNFADYLDTPSYVLNDLAQGNIGDAGHNVARFVVNTIFGFGVLDPATEAGLDARPSDFGQTLYVWGVPEGAYREGRFFGPTTERDTAGFVVDVVTNPVTYILNPDVRWVPPSASTGDFLNERFGFGETIDSVLYESADSYVQTRSLYLQNRRFELGQEADTDFDPYDFDPYADSE